MKNAVGFNTDRSDEVKVVEMTHTMPDAITEAPPSEMTWVDWLELSGGSRFGIALLLPSTRRNDRYSSIVRRCGDSCSGTTSLSTRA